MIILPTLRYGDAAYGLASLKTLKTLDPVYHKAVRLALGTFAVCRIENVLHETGILTLAETIEQDTTIRVITNENESHPTRSYFMNNKIHDEYATKPRTIKSLSIRAIKF
jgi:hypothetical protein